MSMYSPSTYTPSSANKFPAMKSGGKAGTVRGVSSPSPQFSQLSDVKPATGGAKKSSSPTVGYHRANCY